jgi:hypothetical protein
MTSVFNVRSCLAGWLSCRVGWVLRALLGLLLDRKDGCDWSAVCEGMQADCDGEAQRPRLVAERRSRRRDRRGRAAGRRPVTRSASYSETAAGHR